MWFIGAFSFALASFLLYHTAEGSLGKLIHGRETGYWYQYLLAFVLYLFGGWAVSSGVVETNCFDHSARTFVVSYSTPGDCCAGARRGTATSPSGAAGARAARASGRSRRFRIDDIANVRVQRRGKFTHAADSRHYCVVVSVREPASAGGDALAGSDGGAAAAGDDALTFVEILNSSFLHSASENCVRIQHFLNVAGVEWGDGGAGGDDDGERLVLDDDGEDGEAAFRRRDTAVGESTKAVELTEVQHHGRGTGGFVFDKELVVNL